MPHTPASPTTSVTAPSLTPVLALFHHLYSVSKENNNSRFWEFKLSKLPSWSVLSGSQL